MLNLQEEYTDQNDRKRGEQTERDFPPLTDGPLGRLLNHPEQRREQGSGKDGKLIGARDQPGGTVGAGEGDGDKEAAETHRAPQDPLSGAFLQYRQGLAKSAADQHDDQQNGEYQEIPETCGPDPASALVGHEVVEYVGEGEKDCA